MSVVTGQPDLAGAPLARRLVAWTGERHGAELLVPVLLLYALAAATGAAGTSAAHVAPGLLVLGGVAAWTWFLMLRVVDDLADKADDDVVHPERLLQRGVVTTRELTEVAIAAAALCGVISLIIDGGLGAVTLLWALSLAFIGAAIYDFGAGSFLESRPFLARMLRVPASALPVIWFAEMGSGGTKLTLAIAALVVVAILIVVSIDVSRKLKPAAEGELSWSDRLGEGRAHAVLAAVVGLLALGCVLLLAAADAATTIALVALVIAGVLGALAVAHGNAKIAPLVTLLAAAITLTALLWVG